MKEKKLASFHYASQEINGTTTRIEAVDPDQPNTQNSRVLYRLEGTNSDLFNIDFNTGIVTVARGECVCSFIAYYC